MMTKFTPGPWVVRNAIDVFIDVPSGKHIADCWPDPEDQTEEGYANARLIAAAPEMFEALHWIIEDSELLGYFEQFGEWHDKAVAALKLATEVTP